jgi:hypothetical protein
MKKLKQQMQDISYAEYKSNIVFHLFSQILQEMILVHFIKWKNL